VSSFAVLIVFMAVGLSNSMICPQTTPGETVHVRYAVAVYRAWLS